MIVLIDNYDSFSYNLYQLLGQFDPDITVIRNDEKTVQDIEAMHPDHLIISPGPGRPADAGVCEEAISYFGRVSILGRIRMENPFSDFNTLFLEWLE